MHVFLLRLCEPIVCLPHRLATLRQQRINAECTEFPWNPPGYHEIEACCLGCCWCPNPQDLPNFNILGTRSAVHCPPPSRDVVCSSLCRLGCLCNNKELNSNMIHSKSSNVQASLCCARTGSYLYPVLSSYCLTMEVNI